jgi:DNA repair exonuclease SbcCD ATPase subunit
VNVTRLHLRGVTVHADTCLDFPARGVVLVTGTNGAGKSSVIEGVSVALWGRTLRGSSPWSGELGTALANLSDGTLVTRARAKGRTSLDFVLPGVPAEKYDTATKAQAALERAIGPWEVWRRTSVFSSHDAAHFSLASDGERKRMLEGLLGLDAFDGALDACRHDLRGAEAKARDGAQRLAVLRERLAAAERALAGARADVASAAQALPPAGATRDVRGLYDAAAADLAETHARLRAVARERGAAEARAAELSARLRALRGGTCPTCLRPVPAETLAELAGSLASAREEGARELAAVEGGAGALEAQAGELREETEALAQAVRVHDRAESARGAHGAALRRAQMAQGAADRLTAEVLAALGTHAAEQAVAEREAATLVTTADVLGLRGVRAHLLTRTLAGIEGVANVWLSRIAGPRFRLSLRGQTERKTGGVSDTISLHLDGAANGEGYAGASGGERRRIDVALLLALAEVSAGAAGHAPGTLFFDEVFDALDADGRGAVVAALSELSRDRAVIVITHNDALIASLRPAVRWHVAAGKVHVS